MSGLQHTQGRMRPPRASIARNSTLTELTIFNGYFSFLRSADSEAPDQGSNTNTILGPPYSVDSRD